MGDIILMISVVIAAISLLVAIAQLVVMLIEYTQKKK